MKRTKTVGVFVMALLAAVALAAVGSASASAAEPALYECHKLAKVEKKYHGKYTDKKCSVESATHEGAYELQEGIGKGKAFKGKGKGANLEIVGVGGVTCTSSADTGKFTGPKAAGGIKVTFKGCELVHHQCENTATVGEIKTNPLKGEVGYIEGGKSEHKVGVALTAETGLYEAEFHCGEQNLRVTGAVVGLLTSPRNVFTKEATLLFEQTAGAQKYKQIEGGPNEELLTELGAGGEWFGEKLQSGESTEVTNKGEELELKA